MIKIRFILNNQNIRQLMSQDSYFEHYLEIINDSIKKIRKIGFKKLPALTDFINQLTGTLSITIGFL